MPASSGDLLLQTNRLLLRLPEADDVDAMLQFFAQNESHFAPTAPPRAATFGQAEYFEARIAAAHKEFAARLGVQALLFEKESAALIGTATLSGVQRGPFMACYLGYGIGKAHEGRGLMFEALEALVAYAFDGLGMHRVMANHLPDNERSAKLLARLGFEVEGLAKNYLFINGAWRDHVLTARTNADPRCVPHL